MALRSGMFTLTALALVFGVGAFAFRQEDQPAVTPELRQRWEALSEKERARLRERFAELERLSPEERDRMQRRAKRLGEIARHLYRSLDEDERAKLDQLDPDKRREVLREMAAEHARKMGQRILALLPAEDRERLLRARPEDREIFFLEFRQRQLRRLDEIIRRQAKNYLSDAERERLAGLSQAERRAKYLDFYKRHVRHWVAEHGLPDGVTPERWKALQEMPPIVFNLAWERIRERQGLPSAMRPEQATPGARRLFEAYWAGEERDRIDLEQLDPQERVQRQELWRKRRVLAVARELEAEGILRPEELRMLQTADPAQLITSLRRLAGLLMRREDRGK